jgi:prepilin-type N-terminal cleavage/methylation domain-containing protein
MIGRLGRRLRRGFTLVELMVALAMGLIVGTTVVALSKEVTNTFHEEARIITAESGVRVAMDRLRADISRASMMASPNAVVDPAATFAISPAAQKTYLTQMAGVRIISGGSTSTSGYLAGTASFNSGSPMDVPTSYPSPDAIEITGNLSSNGDYYSVQSQSTGVGCGSQRLIISNTDAAYRVGSIDGGPGIDADRAFRLMFLPDTKAGVTAPTTQYYARIQDRNSTLIPLPQQYVLVCNAGYTGGNLYVDLTTTSTITKTSLGEGMIINPVHTVRWRIAKSSSATLNPTGDPKKYDLIRTFLDYQGNEVGGPDNLAGEVIAEYMIDMKFTGSVDSTPAGNADAGPQISALPFDDGGIEKWAGPITATTKAQAALLPPSGSPAPQRVRSIGIRLSSRASTPDRTLDIYPDPSNTSSPYMYRLQVGDAGQYARVRTLVSEVVLINQGNATYP